MVKLILLICLCTFQVFVLLPQNTGEVVDSPFQIPMNHMTNELEIASTILLIHIFYTGVCCQCISGQFVEGKKLQKFETLLSEINLNETGTFTCMLLYCSNTEQWCSFPIFKWIPKWKQLNQNPLEPFHCQGLILPQIILASKNVGQIKNVSVTAQIESLDEYITEQPAHVLVCARIETPSFFQFKSNHLRLGKCM